MIDGKWLVAWLASEGVSHFVWLPDSELGKWESALDASSDIQLVRVCREAEAFGIAAGLWLGGAHPVVALQCTGLYDSGDALRNVLYDLGVPLFLFVGYRNYPARHRPDGDSAARFLEPVLRAWDLRYVVVEDPDDVSSLVDFFRDSRRQGVPGAALIAESKG